MGKWIVIGADATTGKDVTLKFDAASADAAEAMARYNGVLVSQIQPASMPALPAGESVLDYRSPPTAPPALPPKLPAHTLPADGEKVFLQLGDAMITNVRVTVQGKSILLRNITSTQVIYVPPNNVGLIIVGVLLIVIAMGVFMGGLTAFADDRRSTSPLGFFVVALTMGALAAVFLYAAHGMVGVFDATLICASGERDVIRFDKAEAAETFIAMVNQAIVAANSG